LKSQKPSPRSPPASTRFAVRFAYPHAPRSASLSFASFRERGCEARKAEPTPEEHTDNTLCKQCRQGPPKARTGMLSPRSKNGDVIPKEQERGCYPQGARTGMLSPKSKCGDYMLRENRMGRQRSPSHPIFPTNYEIRCKSFIYGKKPPGWVYCRSIVIVKNCN
jgi:hypothetical protein